MIDIKAALDRKSARSGGCIRARDVGIQTGTQEDKVPETRRASRRTTQTTLVTLHVTLARLPTRGQCGHTASIAAGAVPAHPTQLVCQAGAESLHVHRISAALGSAQHESIISAAVRCISRALPRSPDIRKREQEEKHTPPVLLPFSVYIGLYRPSRLYKKLANNQEEGEEEWGRDAGGRGATGDAEPNPPPICRSCHRPNFEVNGTHVGTPRPDRARPQQHRANDNAKCYPIPRAKINDCSVFCLKKVWISFVPRCFELGSTVVSDSESGTPVEAPVAGLDSRRFELANSKMGRDGRDTLKNSKIISDWVEKVSSTYQWSSTPRARRTIKSSKVNAAGCIKPVPEALRALTRCMAPHRQKFDDLGGFQAVFANFVTRFEHSKIPSVTCDRLENIRKFSNSSKRFQECPERGLSLPRFSFEAGETQVEVEGKKGRENPVDRWHQLTCRTSAQPTWLRTVGSNGARQILSEQLVHYRFASHLAPTREAVTMVRPSNHVRPSKTSRRRFDVDEPDLKSTMDLTADRRRLSSQT
ncbi:hypothetical protein C8R47DRAFT_1066412 [Mycena vitilis]|nr:hypothetical protein C8R47DRAFT_1066412 [Mycena vitilis]